jgi:hypothetical protein
MNGSINMARSYISSGAAGTSTPSINRAGRSGIGLLPGDTIDNGVGLLFPRVAGILGKTAVADSPRLNSGSTRNWH